MKIMARNGFTLIELSIVLVIIGLIIGAVLLGKDLIDASKTRAQITQLEALETQINTFKIKYNCLPGDCASATQFLSNHNGYSIYNGDGDGIIMGTNDGYSVGNCFEVSAIPTDGLGYGSNEIAQLFHHLNSSGLSNYDNKKPPEDTQSDVNSPSLPPDIYNGGMFVSCITQQSSTPPLNFELFPNFMNGTAIVIGGDNLLVNSYSTRLRFIAGGSSSNLLRIPVRSARSIDIKIDDGLSGTGSVGALQKRSCVTAQTSYDGMPSTCNIALAKKIFK